MKKIRHMSVFSHIVEAGSITAAADSLQLSKSVVSQHLKLLEQELGVLLIKRSTRKHTLTSAGKDFYESCKAINKITEFAWQKAQGTTKLPQGPITITAPNALMDIVIAPTIAKLLLQYPLLEPELNSGDSQLDLMANNIDLAIRVGPSQASNIKQRRIGKFRDILCGSHALLQNDNIDKPVYIANTWQGKHVSHQFVDAKGNKVHYEANALCRANSFYSCLALIKEGVGIGVIPDFQFNTMKPFLSEVFPELTLPINSIYALHTYDNHLPASISVCITAIEKRLIELSNSE
ncbi:MAG: transcriptional regulator [Colwellia sp. Phe_37]|nr:MAG: transcriptional regulator [Colwellia sp. Phe_37]